MANGNTQQNISDIKKELRANMNGVASAAMRQTDDYRVNWGIELPRVHAIASEFEPSRELAQALWNESVRECKILATMLMPKDEFIEELCDIWVENIRTDEIAQIFCINLVQHMPYASTKAFEWIATRTEGEESTSTQHIAKDQRENCGYLTLCHLLRRSELNERSAEEFLDQASSALNNRYAVKALQCFASQSEENEKKVKKIADYL